MIVAVLQTCDACGVEDRAKGMHMPEGWFMFDLRGGKDPGVVGYGWNVCSVECMQRTIKDWSEGKNPMPYGMSEESQVIRSGPHGEHHAHADPVEAEIAAMAAAAAEVAQAREPGVAWLCSNCAEGAETDGLLPEGWVSIGDSTAMAPDNVCSATCAVAYFARHLN